MSYSSFNEGVRPGGLTTGTQVRILLCYILDNVKAPLTRSLLETVLLEGALANYFVLADSLAQLVEQGLATLDDGGAYILTSAGRTVAQSLEEDLPRSVKEAAINGVIAAQQHATNAAANKSEVVTTSTGRAVRCTIADETGELFSMQLYMPDQLTAESARRLFAQNGSHVYRLVLAALTQNKQLAQDAIEKLQDTAKQP